jgi:hypothetical protein
MAQLGTAWEQESMLAHQDDNRACDGATTSAIVCTHKYRLVCDNCQTILLYDIGRVFRAYLSGDEPDVFSAL